MQEIKEVTCPCMMPGFSESRELIFPDGIRVRMKGLNRLFEIAYQERKQPNKVLAGVMVSGQRHSIAVGI